MTTDQVNKTSESDLNSLRVKEIPLTQGFSALIDEADFALVQPFKWRVKRNGRTNYAISDHQGKRLWMHRVILGIDKPCDHQNDNGLDNRRFNLRPLGNKNNIRRKRPNLNGSSKFKGVCRQRDKWQATIKVDGRNIHIGLFRNETVAARAYDAAARQHFGEYCYQNFPL